jgi:prevent-host-death family protein
MREYMDDTLRPAGQVQRTVGAYEAKTKFSELIARAEKGESFTVTKNGKPVARILPTVDFEREQARRAADELREFRAKQGPPVSAEAARRNWEQLKAELEAEDDEQDARWLSSSMPR